MMADPNLIPTEEERARVIAKQKAIWVRTAQGEFKHGSSNNEN